MKKAGLVALMCLCVSVFVLGQLCEAAGRGPQPKPAGDKVTPSAVSRINGSGDIKGEIFLVAPGANLPSDTTGTCKATFGDVEVTFSVEDAVVYVLGHSFAVKPKLDATNGAGDFTIYNVPADTYSLVVEIPGLKGAREDGVVVNAKYITNLTASGPNGPINVECAPVQ